MKTIKLSAAAVLIFAATFSSCKKENVNNDSATTTAVDQGTEATANRGAASLVIRPGGKMRGDSYGEWSTRYWRWAMELPAVANHPLFDNPGYDITMGQSGPVWFLPSVMPGTVTRNGTVPHGVALMCSLSGAEASDLKGYGSTYLDLLVAATAQADGITNVFCIIDGDFVLNPSEFRVISPAPAFSFNAPTPWVFGATGGSGISVSDGYFVIIKGLARGNHTVRFGGQIPSLTYTTDMTYNITVQ